MKKKHLRVIIRRYRDGWKCKRIAQALGYSQSAVSNICNKKELFPYIGELKLLDLKRCYCDRMVAGMLKPKKQKRKSRPRTKTLRSVMAQITGVSTKVPFDIINVQENDGQIVMTAEQKTNKKVVRYTMSVPKQKKRKKWVPSKSIPDDKIKQIALIS